MLLKYLHKQVGKSEAVLGWIFYCLNRVLCRKVLAHVASLRIYCLMLLILRWFFCGGLKAKATIRHTLITPINVFASDINSKRASHTEKGLSDTMGGRQMRGCMDRSSGQDYSGSLFSTYAVISATVKPFTLSVFLRASHYFSLNQQE